MGQMSSNTQRATEHSPYTQQLPLPQIPYLRVLPTDHFVLLQSSDALNNACVLLDAIRLKLADA